MGTRAILCRALRVPSISQAGSAPQTAPMRVLELGAGDGTLMLGVARALAPAWPAVALTLLDRQSLVDQATIAAYGALGWRAAPEVADVLDWAACAADPVLQKSGAARWDLVVANLFLHHFEGPELRALLVAIARRCDRFLACEPRRGWLALGGSHLIGALGTNAVTREDSVSSVHAGFRGQELSSLWPGGGKDWRMREYRAGLFSHCFWAERKASQG
jgi:hypothetical protein